LRLPRLTDVEVSWPGNSLPEERAWELLVVHLDFRAVDAKRYASLYVSFQQDEPPSGLVTSLFCKIGMTL
jgi:hypothetical protein